MKGIAAVEAGRFFKRVGNIVVIARLQDNRNGKLQRNVWDDDRRKRIVKMKSVAQKKERYQQHDDGEHLRYAEKSPYRFFAFEVETRQRKGGTACKKRRKDDRRRRRF